MEIINLGLIYLYTTSAQGISVTSEEYIEFLKKLQYRK